MCTFLKTKNKTKYFFHLVTHYEHFLMSNVLHDFSSCIIEYTRVYLITFNFEETDNVGEYFKFIVTLNSLCTMPLHKAIFLFIITANPHTVPMMTYELLWCHFEEEEIEGLRS